MSDLLSLVVLTAHTDDMGFDLSHRITCMALHAFN